MGQDEAGSAALSVVSRSHRACSQVVRKCRPLGHNRQLQTGMEEGKSPSVHTPSPIPTPSPNHCASLFHTQWFKRPHGHTLREWLSRETGLERTLYIIKPSLLLLQVPTPQPQSQAGRAPFKFLLTLLCGGCARVEAAA